MIRARPALAVAGMAATLAFAGNWLTTPPRAAGSVSPLRLDLLSEPITPRLGGDTTRIVASDKAYTFLAENAPAERSRPFFFGNRLFNTNWVIFPASVKDFDGLGPTFNRTSCSGCHVRDGRGRPPEKTGDPMNSMLVRLSIPGPDGKAIPHPAYGDQLNDRAIPGVKPEGRAVIDEEMMAGAYGDGTPYTLLKPHYRFIDLAYGPLDGAQFSPRVAPAVIGLGLLQSVPLSTLEALEDPDDADGDGISGRINRLVDHDGKPAAGRFGWKANVATLREQAAGAAVGDMGITTTLFPDQNCMAGEADCRAALADPGPEMKPSFLDRLVIYMETLAVPVARNLDDPTVARGQLLFRDFGCAACHLPTLKTDVTAALPELRNQLFHPFTDLLLHDMGEGLADGRPDQAATGSEWRTPPLWGLGLIEKVNGHDRLLHDGRARGPAEAILWHGGEAMAAAEKFRTASAGERAALLAFLNAI
ncbi:MAG: di-heme oxidoredictase family protein [Bauldia sp.]